MVVLEGGVGVESVFVSLENTGPRLHVERGRASRLTSREGASAHPSWDWAEKWTQLPKENEPT